MTFPGTSGSATRLGGDGARGRSWIPRRRGTRPRSRRLLAILLAAGFLTGAARATAAEVTLDATASQRLEEVRRDVRDRARGKEATEASRKLVEEFENRFGPEAMETAEALDLLAESLWRAGNAGEPEARRSAERAVAIKEKLGDLRRLSSSVSNLGWAIRMTGALRESRPFFERALELREKALGPDHVEVGWSLENLGSLLDELGEFEEARPRLERALKIAESRWGKGNHELVSSLYTLGNLLRKLGDYAGAEARHTEALAIERREHPKGHLHTAFVLNALAIDLYKSGRLREAQADYEEVLAIAQRELPDDDAFLDTCRNNLAVLLSEIGDFAEARKVLQDVLSRRLTSSDPDPITLATNEYNLARLLFMMGDNAAARRLHESALARRQRVLGSENPEVASSHLELADVLSLSGEYELADIHYEKALGITKSLLGTEYEDYARALAGRAANRRRMGRQVSALALYRLALDSLRHALGDRHPDVALLEIDYAQALLDAGEASRARDMLVDAEGILTETMGPAHPKLASARAALGEAKAALGHTGEALEAALSAERITREHVQLTARFLPEALALRYAAFEEPALDLAMRLARRGLPADGRRGVLDAVIRSRALILDEMAARSAAAHAAQDDKASKLGDAYAEASARLAYLVMAEPPRERPDNYRSLLEAAAREKDRAMEALAGASAAFREDLARRSAGLKEVEAALPPGSALVSFVIHDSGRTGGAPARKESAGRVYTAFVLRQGNPDPHVVSLGSEGRIDPLVAAWRDAAAPESARRGGEADEGKYLVAARKLRKEIWDPLEPALEGAGMVFIVPAGPLSLVNFAALPSHGEGYLVERGPLFHYISAERDLARDAGRAVSSSGLLAVGGPTFDAAAAPAAVVAAALEPPARRPDASAAGASRSACAAFEEGAFHPLPASAGEAQEVVDIWRRAAGEEGAAREGPASPAGGAAILLKEGEATETAFRAQAPGKRVLHLATHGFFLEGRCASALDSARGVTGISSRTEGILLPVAGENPLLLTGLALAGANQRRLASSGEADGILTAEEIASLDLSGVEWAVLSACDTGTGVLKANEGVFGLRRAFQVAGARTVVMSLWPVLDADAKEWMQALYEARFLQGRSTAEAVRQAARALLRRRREAGESTHPFHWAAFVAAGDWR